MFYFEPFFSLSLRVWLYYGYALDRSSDYEFRMEVFDTGIGFYSRSQLSSVLSVFFLLCRLYPNYGQGSIIYLCLVFLFQFIWLYVLVFILIGIVLHKVTTASIDSVPHVSETQHFINKTCEDWLFGVVDVS